MTISLCSWPISVSADDIILVVECGGDPIAHQRPRRSRGGHFYTPNKTREYKEKLADIIKTTPRSSARLLAMSDTYGVQAKFYRSNRQRIDVDNLLKTIMDATTTAGLWLDDSQVHEICGTVEKGSPRPRVEFMIYRHHLRGDEASGGDYDFQKKCAHCGRDISRKSYPSTQRKYCSNNCASEAKRLKLRCPQCGKDFSVPQSFMRRNVNPGGGFYARRFCSRECSIKYHSNLRRTKGKESDKWICTMCDGRVSRKEYKVCRACSMKTRSDPTTNYWKLRHPSVEIKIRPAGEEP